MAVINVTFHMTATGTYELIPVSGDPRQLAEGKDGFRLTSMLCQRYMSGVGEGIGTGVYNIALRVTDDTFPIYAPDYLYACQIEDSVGQSIIVFTSPITVPLDAFYLSCAVGVAGGVHIMFEGSYVVMSELDKTIITFHQTGVE